MRLPDSASCACRLMSAWPQKAIGSSLSKRGAELIITISRVAHLLCRYSARERGFGSGKAQNVILHSLQAGSVSGLTLSAAFYKNQLEARIAECYLDFNFGLRSPRGESKRTIEIDEFVPKKEIDELYLNSPYYLAPDGEVGQQAFAVIREAIRKEGMVALGRVVFTSREHVIALEPRGKGLLGITLRYPYEVRKEDEYFEDIPDEKIPKDMLELASHIVETKSGHFDPQRFEDQYEDALKELLKKKQAGEKIEAPEERAPAKI